LIPTHTQQAFAPMAQRLLKATGNREGFGDAGHNKLHHRRYPRRPACGIAIHSSADANN
jgi:hypothetical protein